jgi:hypothetical protein
VIENAEFSFGDFPKVKPISTLSAAARMEDVPSDALGRPDVQGMASMGD